MKLAVEGCCHGELDNIYATLIEINQRLSQTGEEQVQLLIICGDFQSLRNADDMECLACPVKYRAIGTFYKYYSGEKVAPVPTIFIGGNHEASNYLQELFYGGWVAPNIWYMGAAGVIRFGGIRIGGLSGIFKSGDYVRERNERPPYNANSLRSIYHVRAADVRRMKMLSPDTLDIFLSHDWPRGIARHGNMQQLFRMKSFLRNEVLSNVLGSPPAEELLYALRPKYWFSAHLHVKFPALVEHRQASSIGQTKFLALDKCLPGRDFLQVIDVPGKATTTTAAAAAKPVFEYDPEWLAILRATHGAAMNRREHQSRPGEAAPLPPQPADVDAIHELLQSRGGAEIPHNFVKTVAPFDPSTALRHGTMPREVALNPQTLAFLELLKLPLGLDPATIGHGNPRDVSILPRSSEPLARFSAWTEERCPVVDNAEIILPSSDDGEDDPDGEQIVYKGKSALDNPEEI